VNSSSLQKEHHDILHTPEAVSGPATNPRPPKYELEIVNMFSRPHFTVSCYINFVVCLTQFAEYCFLLSQSVSGNLREPLALQSSLSPQEALSWPNRNARTAAHHGFCCGHQLNWGDVLIAHVGCAYCPWLGLTNYAASFPLPEFRTSHNWLVFIWTFSTLRENGNSNIFGCVTQYNSKCEEHRLIEFNIV
jgi:hypothetical protein